MSDRIDPREHFGLFDEYGNPIDAESVSAPATEYKSTDRVMREPGRGIGYTEYGKSPSRPSVTASGNRRTAYQDDLESDRRNDGAGLRRQDTRLREQERISKAFRKALIPEDEDLDDIRRAFRPGRPRKDAKVTRAAVIDRLISGYGKRKRGDVKVLAFFLGVNKKTASAYLKLIDENPPIPDTLINEDIQREGEA